MKQDAIHHVKMQNLKRELSIPLYRAVGLVEMLHQFAANCADEGDIGKWTNNEIASYLEWEGDTNELIDAFVVCRWVDETCDDSRLRIHDWLEHCPAFILKRLNRRYESGGLPTADNGGQRPTDQGKPRETKGNPTKGEGGNSQANDSPPNPPPKTGSAFVGELAKAWNGIGWVNPVRLPLAKSNLAAGEKGWRVRELQKLIKDPAAIVAAIDEQRGFFEGQGWFRFTWLFKSDRHGERNLIKIMDRAYKDSRDSSQPKIHPANGPGYTYDSSANGGGFGEIDESYLDDVILEEDE